MLVSHHFRLVAGGWPSRFGMISSGHVRLEWSEARLTYHSQRSAGTRPAENGNPDLNYAVFVGVVDAFWAHARWATPAGRSTDFSFSSILREQYTHTPMLRIMSPLHAPSLPLFGAA